MRSCYYFGLFDMVPYKLYFVGIQLLLLSHNVKSFILLTANMEDVKKIARKFVSNHMAEKIAEFVATATQQMVSNVSKENDENEDEIQNNSDDNNRQQNIGRQRFETVTPKYFDRDIKHEQTHKYAVEETSTTNDWANSIVNTGQNINWEKETNEIPYGTYSKEAEINRINVYEKLKHDDGLSNSLDNPKHEPDQPIAEYELEQSTPEYEQAKFIEQPIAEVKQDFQIYEQAKFIEQPIVQVKQDFDKYSQIFEQIKPKSNQPQYYEPKHEEPITRKQKLRPHKKKPIKYMKEAQSFDHQDDISNQDQAKYEDENSKLSRYITVKPTIDSTILYRETHNHKTFVPPKQNLKLRQNRGHRLVSFDSNEMKPNVMKPNEMEPHEMKYMLNITRSTSQVFNMQRAMTTRKEKIEFDQYDIPKNQKVDYIATSGPVALPKLPVQKPWWEKEMPTPKEKPAQMEMQSIL